MELLWISIAATFTLADAVLLFYLFQIHQRLMEIHLVLERQNQLISLLSQQNAQRRPPQSQQER